MDELCTNYDAAWRRCWRNGRQLDCIAAWRRCWRRLRLDIDAGASAAADHRAAGAPPQTR
jgi:hypothetical protein